MCQNASSDPGELEWEKVRQELLIKLKATDEKHELLHKQQEATTNPDDLQRIEEELRNVHNDRRFLLDWLRDWK